LIFCGWINDFISPSIEKYIFKFLTRFETHYPFSCLEGGFIESFAIWSGIIRKTDWLEPEAFIEETFRSPIRRFSPPWQDSLLALPGD